MLRPCWIVHSPILPRARRQGHTTKIPTSKAESVEQCQIISARALRAVASQSSFLSTAEWDRVARQSLACFASESNLQRYHCTEASEVQRADGALFWIRRNTIRARISPTWMCTIA